MATQTLKVKLNDAPRDVLVALSEHDDMAFAEVVTAVAPVDLELGESRRITARALRLLIDLGLATHVGDHEVRGSVYAATADGRDTVAAARRAHAAATEDA